MFVVMYYVIPVVRYPTAVLPVRFEVERLAGTRVSLTYPWSELVVSGQGAVRVLQLRQQYGWVSNVDPTAGREQEHGSGH
jgi:hypothetical protein